MISTVIIDNKEFTTVMGCIWIDGNWKSISETKKICENMTKQIIHTTCVEIADVGNSVKTVITDSALIAHEN